MAGPYVLQKSIQGAAVLQREGEAAGERPDWLELTDRGQSSSDKPWTKPDGKN